MSVETQPAPELLPYRSEWELMFFQYLKLQEVICTTPIRTELFNSLLFGVVGIPVGDGDSSMISWRLQELKLDHQDLIEAGVWKTVMGHIDPKLIAETIRIGQKLDEVYELNLSSRMQDTETIEKFDDVYHLAWFMLKSSFFAANKPHEFVEMDHALADIDQDSTIMSYYYDDDRPKNYLLNLESQECLYRGQNQTWPIIPTIFRPEPGETAASEAQIKQRYARTMILVAALENELPGIFTPEQRLAITQHYGATGKFGTPTWLVDFTLDPLIALFFASYQAKDGQIGSVLEIDRGQLQKMGTAIDGRNLIGTLREIDFSPDRIPPRIDSQEAVFLENVHPDLLCQYQPREWRFHQHTDMIFEAPQWGIDIATLLPDNDPYLEFVRGWEPSGTPPPTSDSLQLPPNPNRSLEPSDYIAIATAWVKAALPELTITTEVEAVIATLGNIHNDFFLLQQNNTPYLNQANLRTLYIVVDHIVIASLAESKKPSNPGEENFEMFYLQFLSPSASRSLDYFQNYPEVAARAAAYKSAQEKIKAVVACHTGIVGPW